ncbi:MAG: M24 family metallopeptidase [Geminicoccaceae bacterium]
MRASIRRDAAGGRLASRRSTSSRPGCSRGVRRAIPRPSPDRGLHARSWRARPATPGYRGYPRSRLHLGQPRGQPRNPSDDKKLKDGDIANIDVTVILDGWYGALPATCCRASAPVKAHKLVEVTFAWLAGIEAVRPGATLGDVGHAIQTIARPRKANAWGRAMPVLLNDAPEVRHFGRPGEGLRCGRACCSRSSP